MNELMIMIQRIQNALALQGITDPTAQQVSQTAEAVNPVPVVDTPAGELVQAAALEPTATYIHPGVEVVSTTLITSDIAPAPSPEPTATTVSFAGVGPNQIISDYLALNQKATRDDLLVLALASVNQDAFVQAMRTQHGTTTPRNVYRQVFKAARAELVAAGLWPKPVGGKLQQQVERKADAKTDALMSEAAGTAAKQEAVQATENAHGSWTMIARRIARELAQHGPITIDDITEAMSRQYAVEPLQDGGSHSWKGSVFTSAEWTYMGTMPSRLPTSHARPVGLWALKTWAQQHSTNGKEGKTSAFNLVRLLHDFKKAHPNVDLKRCNLYLGDQQLAEDIRTTIVNAEMHLYEIPVTFMPGGVGAALLPPNYAAEQEKHGST